MANIGEELVGAWLRYVAECDFIQYNVPLRDVQGELDVIGLNLETNTAYICEVATHLILGLQYVKNNQPDNVNRLTKKFSLDIEYARKYLKGFDCRFMLWSPIIKHPVSDNVKHNQIVDLAMIQQTIQNDLNEQVEMIVNEVYLERVHELHQLAKKTTANSEYPVFRLFQILEHLDKHVSKLQERGIDTLAAIEYLMNEE